MKGVNVMYSFTTNPFLNGHENMNNLYEAYRDTENDRVRAQKLYTFINDYLNCAKALGYAISNDILVNIAQSDILEYARRNNIPARVVNITANAMLSEEFDYVNISGNYDVCTELLGALSIIESIDDI
jgi:hypothetical protein